MPLSFCYLTSLNEWPCIMIPVNVIKCWKKWLVINVQSHWRENRPELISVAIYQLEELKSPVAVYCNWTIWMRLLALKAHLLSLAIAFYLCSAPPLSLPNPICLWGDESTHLANCLTIQVHSFVLCAHFMFYINFVGKKISIRFAFQKVMLSKWSHFVGRYAICTFKFT